MGWLRVVKMTDLTAFRTRDTLDQFAVVMNAMEYNHHPLYSRDCGRIVFDFMLYDKDVHTYENVCKTGNLTVLKWLNDDTPSADGIVRQIGKRDPRNLVNACRIGHLEMVKYLVEVVGTTDSSSAFVTACGYGYLEIVKYLFAQVEVGDLSQSALRQACCNQHLDVVRFLFDQGALIYCLNLVEDILATGNVALIKLAIPRFGVWYLDHSPAIIACACRIQSIELIDYMMDVWNANPTDVLSATMRCRPPAFLVMDHVIHERGVHDLDEVVVRECSYWLTASSTSGISHLVDTGYVSREVLSRGLLEAYTHNNIPVAKYLVETYFIPITAEMREVHRRPPCDSDVWDWFQSLGKRR